MHSDPRERLEDIITEGVAIDLYHVLESISLEEFVGREAGRINAATFGAFFGSLQLILGRFLVLQTARIFERPSSKYVTRSIPSAISVLRENSERLIIEQRPALVRSLSRLGARGADLERLRDPELTRFSACFFGDRLSDSHAEGIENAAALDRVITVRDKWVAHPESIRVEDLPRSTFADIDRLSEFAMKFVGAIGLGYVNSVYEDSEGKYLMMSDARRSTVCLKRLLAKAEVIPSTDPFA